MHDLKRVNSKDVTSSNKRVKTNISSKSHTQSSSNISQTPPLKSFSSKHVLSFKTQQLSVNRLKKGQTSNSKGFVYDYNPISQQPHQSSKSQCLGKQKIQPPDKNTFGSQSKSQPNDKYKPKSHNPSPTKFSPHLYTPRPYFPPKHTPFHSQSLDYGSHYDQSSKDHPFHCEPQRQQFGSYPYSNSSSESISASSISGFRNEKFQGQSQNTLSNSSVKNLPQSSSYNSLPPPLPPKKSKCKQNLCEIFETMYLKTTRDPEDPDYAFIDDSD